RQNVIGCGSGRAVRAFGEDAALHAIHVAAGDDVLGGSGNQDFAFRGQQFGGIVLLGARESVDRSVLLAKFDESLEVDTVLVVEAAAHFGDADYLVAGFVHEQRGVRADIAKALHDDAAAFAIEAEFLAGIVADHHHTSAGSLAASAGAADV